MATAKIYVVEKFKKRESNDSGNTFIMGSVLECGANQVVPCYFNDGPEKLKDNILALASGDRVLLTNSIRSPTSLKVTTETKVITKICNFEVNMDSIEKFVRPEIVSVAEAKGLPVKKRLSICGEVVTVGECVVTSKYHRQSVKLRGDGAEINLVLWDEATLFELSCGDCVTITAVVKDKSHRVSSTQSTQISPITTPEKTGTIIGIDSDNGFPVEIILDDGDSLYLPESVYFDTDQKLPINIKYTAAASKTVTQIRVSE